MPAFQDMPYPEHLENNLAMIIGTLLPMFAWMSFAIVILPLARRIVQEKQTGVKELMKMMGLPNWMHWITWYVNAMLTSTVTIVIIVLLLCVTWKEGTGSVLDYSDPSVIFIFFAFYTAGIVTFTFTLTTFFDSREFVIFPMIASLPTSARFD
jgi:ATP-binding cassette subfamily A (ABC1) protein 3